MKLKITFIILILSALTSSAQICNSSGNLVIYSNYDGGILTINVDQDIPNLYIGITTYEPIQVDITGPFVGNVAGVIYAGFNSAQGNNNCGLGDFPTSITGVPANIIDINPAQQPPQVGYTPAHGNGSGPWGGGMLGTSGACDTLVDGGGGNTPDEIVYYFENTFGAQLISHFTQYDCWINETLNISDGGTCCIEPPQPGQGCQPNSNLVIYSNYEGGAFTINVDQDIPNLKIGICSYEASQVTITGPFAGNVTGVIYAGFNAPNNTGCGGNIPTTTITGVPANLVTIYNGSEGNNAISPFLGEPVAPGFPPLVNCITGAEGSCDASNAGGGNSAPQIAQFFLQEFGAGTALYAHHLSYECFNPSYDISEPGNCCLIAPATDPNPIYTGGSSYNFIEETETDLCNGPITIDLSFYPVLFQPPTYPGYVWSDGTTGPVITITEPGTYSFTVGDYCHFEPDTYLTDTIVVNACCDQPEPPVVTGGDTYCANDNISTLTAQGVAGGIINWYTTASLTTSVATGNTYTPAPSQGTNTYYATVTLDECESESSSVQVILTPLPVANITASQTQVCEGETITLTSAAATGNLWSTGVTSNSITVNTAGTYTLTVTQNGCESNPDDITVTFSPSVQLVITGPAEVCPGSLVTLTASGGSAYSWSNGFTGASISFFALESQEITVSSPLGICSIEGEFEIEVLDVLDLYVGEDITAEREQRFSLLAQNPFDNISWTPSQPLSCSDCNEPNGIITETTQFIATAISPEGCEVSDTVFVFLDNRCSDLFIPNSFTPNNTQPNEVFCIESECIKTMTLQVFNRWGEKVFESRDVEDCWNGGQNGYYLPDGIYNYRLSAVLLNNDAIERFGFVTLIR
jgi:gliding motility-associated-like protein